MATSRRKTAKVEQGSGIGKSGCKYGSARLSESFWNRTHIVGEVSKHISGPCWLWAGFINNRGYGSCYWEGKMQKAHRVAYQALVGPIPANRPQLDHLCRVKSCVNPEHLEPVTGRENQLRGRNGYALTGTCSRGHEMGRDNTYTSKSGRGCLTCKREKVRCESCGKGISRANISAHRKRHRG